VVKITRMAIPSSRDIKIHNNHLAGTATGSFHSDSRLPSYQAYSMPMYNVAAVFKDKMQPFNLNYQPAKMIFADTTAARILRQTIKTQHYALYRDGHRSDRTITKTIRTADDFFASFNYGTYDDRRREYTYVLLEDSFNFSETGASFFTNFMSKHAMHSNAAKSVRYSGEFRVYQRNGKHVLIIDNGSGTYAPDKNDLHFLKEVFQINFPDMEVEVYDFKDPQLLSLKAT